MSEEKVDLLKILGNPITIGELKKMIEKYPDETSFGFRNMPLLTLYEVKGINGKYLVFN
jgi:hypothetical protein